jgi:hypothetical protein
MKMRVEHLQRYGTGGWEWDLIRDYGATRYREHFQTGAFGRGLSRVRWGREDNVSGTFDVSGKSESAVRRTIRAHFAE